MKKIILILIFSLFISKSYARVQPECVPLSYFEYNRIPVNIDAPTSNVWRMELEFYFCHGEKHFIGADGFEYHVVWFDFEDGNRAYLTMDWTGVIISKGIVEKKYL